jgi:hypothetical protein
VTVATIGLDFDNTLVSYDALLARLAEEVHGLGGLPGKKAIRDAVRLTAEGDVAWQRLQGLIYGPRMAEAALVDGAADFLDLCRDRGVRVFVVSHKTAYAGYDPTRTPLRDAARNWMRANGFFDRFAIAEDDVFFAATRAEKVNKIKELGVPAFVDDLEEVFLEPDFPAAVKRLLFHPEGPAPAGPFTVCRSFAEVADAVFA